LKKAIAISLALLMLASSVGFSMNTHFCGGKAVKTSFSIGLHNPDCGMANMDEVCEFKPLSEDQLEPKPCCENQHQVLHLDENAKVSSASIGLNPVFFIAFVHVLLEPNIFADQAFVHYTHYTPPIPDKDIQVLFQAFLI
jgi:hypothetical protein